MDWTIIAQQALALILGAVGGGLCSALVAWRTVRLTARQLNTMQDQLQAMRRAQTKEAADAIFREWWGPEMNGLRRHFYLEFLPQHYPSASAGDPKDLEHRVKDDGAQLRSLTGFFDRVGWLGAAGLVDVDYVLGPMQHTMRRVWFATEPLIRRARESVLPGQLDPVYRLGFEWLSRRSEGKSYASLLADRFSDPALFGTRAIVEALDVQIRNDERAFRGRLEGLRGGTAARRDV